MKFDITALKKEIRIILEEYFKNPDVEFEYDYLDTELTHLQNICQDMITFEALKKDLSSFEMIETTSSKVKNCLKKVEIIKPLFDYYDKDNLGYSKKFLLKGKIP